MGESDVRCREIGLQSYAVTYMVRQSVRLTRPTLWRTDDDGWEILYRQGTIAKVGPASHG